MARITNKPVEATQLERFWIGFSKRDRKKKKKKTRSMDPRANPPKMEMKCEGGNRGEIVE